MGYIDLIIPLILIFCVQFNDRKLLSQAKEVVNQRRKKKKKAKLKIWT